MHKKIECQKCGRPSKGTLCRTCYLTNKSAWRVGKGNLKENISNTILAYIKGKGAYCTGADIRRDLKISDKSVYRFRLSIPQLNYESGTGPKPWVDTKETLIEKIEVLLKGKGFLTTPEICTSIQIPRHILQHRGITLQPIYDRLGLKPPPKYVKEELERLIIPWIKEQGQYCGVSRILKQFGIDFNCSWAALGLDADYLNKQAGFINLKESWYEVRAFKEFKKRFKPAFIQEQKRFTDCKSLRNWALRYDFSIETFTGPILIEVDGDQHYDVGNPYYTEELHANDLIKEKYAEEKDIPLLRIRCSPKTTFEERLQGLLEEVIQIVISRNNTEILKSFELLEQPESPCTTTCPETESVTVKETSGLVNQQVRP